MAVTIDGTNGILSPDFEPSSSTTPTNGLFLPTTNALGFATNSTERLRLDASGNLGLGVTPSAWSSTYLKAIQLGGQGAYVAGNTSAYSAGVYAYLGNNGYLDSAGTFRYTTSTFAAQYAQVAGAHQFFTAPSGTAGNAISFTQAMTLDASGNLVIGGTSANGKLNLVNGDLRLTQTVGGDASGVNSYSLYFNSPSGDLARLYATTEGSPGPAGYGAALKFLTKISNGALAERARIDSSGNLLVGTTTAPSSGKMNIVNGLQMTGASTGTAIASNNGSAEVAYLTLGAVFNVAGSYDVALGISNIATTAGKRIYVQNRTAGVYLADGGTSWTSNSDERLKTDLKPIENAAQKVSTLRAVTGRFKTDDESVSRSFLIAQDVQAVLPEAVDASDPDKLGVQYTDTIPLLVAAIKELTARLETLENK